MSADATRLRLTAHAGVATIRLVRPDAGNAIDLTFARELHAAAARCRELAPRVVVITAEGRHFCVGGDLKAFAAMPDLADHVTEVTSWLHEGIAQLVELAAPVVVAIQGAAAGAGMGLVGLADVAVAARSASFVMAYAAVGLSPDGSSSYFLPRLVGYRRAIDMTMTNRRLDAEEAYAWGLVSRLVEDDELEAETASITASFADAPTSALARSRELLTASTRSTLREQLARETEMLAASAGTKDGQEGVAAFVDRRAPRFQG